MVTKLNAFIKEKVKATINEAIHKTAEMQLRKSQKKTILPILIFLYMCLYVSVNWS